MTQREIAEKWADIAIERLKNNITKLGAVRSGRLLNSFTRKIEESGDSVKKIQIAYEFYGMYVDMGVGKGTKLGDAQKLAGKGRSAKQWYSKTIAAEIHRLSEVMSEDGAAQATAFLKDSLPGKLTFDL